MLHSVKYWKKRWSKVRIKDCLLNLVIKKSVVTLRKNEEQIHWVVWVEPDGSRKQIIILLVPFTTFMSSKVGER